MSKKKITATRKIMLGGYSVGSTLDILVIILDLMAMVAWLGGGNLVIITR
jgi:hypothetical protein